MNEIMNYFINMSYAELIGTIFGLICVYCCVRQYILAWPTGIITVIAFGTFFYDIKLYSDAILQLVYYLPIQFWGWWVWAQKNREISLEDVPVPDPWSGVKISSKELSFFQKWFWSKYDSTSTVKISKLTGTQRFIGIITIMWASIMWGMLMSGYTDASLPYLDALTVGMSIVAQWLIAKRIWENWAIWITMDVLAIGKYAMVGAYMTTGLYAIYTILATMGLIMWWKLLRKEA